MPHAADDAWGLLVRKRSGSASVAFYHQSGDPFKVASVAGELDARRPKRIAVKVVDDRGIESRKVMEVEQ